MDNSNNVEKQLLEDLDGMPIKDRIRYMRMIRGLSRKEFSAKSGISVSAIQKYELGIRSPKLDTLIKIAKALDISLEYLYHEELLDGMFSDNQKYIEPKVNFIAYVNTLGYTVESTMIQRKVSKDELLSLANSRSGKQRDEFLNMFKDELNEYGYVLSNKSYYLIVKDDNTFYLPITTFDTLKDETEEFISDFISKHSENLKDPNE